MRQLVDTVFIVNNLALFHLKWKENLAKQQSVAKYHDHDCNFLHKH